MSVKHSNAFTRLLTKLLQIRVHENKGEAQDCADSFSKAELNALLDEYKRRRSGKKYTGDSAFDAAAVGASDLACREAANDREAEMVRRGLRFGYYLALLSRDDFYRAGARARQNKAVLTKKARLAKRDSAIVDEYRKLQQVVGDLKARQQILDKLQDGWPSDALAATKLKPITTLKQLTAIIRKSE